MSMSLTKKQNTRIENQKKSRLKSMRNDIALYVMLIFPIAIVIIFRYIPMAGAMIAFKDYDFMKGIWGSDFAGLKWFKKFLGDRKFTIIFLNTLKLSISSIIFSFPWPIILA